MNRVNIASIQNYRGHPKVSCFLVWVEANKAWLSSYMVGDDRRWNAFVRQDTKGRTVPATEDYSLYVSLQECYFQHVLNHTETCRLYCLGQGT